MSTPTKKRTKASARRRASHFALKKPATVKCANCGATILPHKACAKCGHYKGKKKITTHGKIKK